MITGATKSKVDAIWQKMWEGGITNPIEVISQLTYLMFMRSLDEKELETEKMEQMLGTELDRIFPEAYRNSYGAEIPGDQLRWSRFKDLPAQEMYRVVNEFAFPFIKQLGDESAFAKAMESATFGFPAGKPSLLERAVDGVEGLLSEFDDHVGDLGDLYEYMLSKLSTAGTNGQFRTPQHIRNMMVAMVDPKPGEFICDPACGTAGFLISAAEHIRNAYESQMTGDDWNSYAGKNGAAPQFSGFEIDQTMLRISTMNLMLHGVDAPDVRYLDSISKNNTVSGKYDVVLANPPFTGSVDVEDIDKSLRGIVDSKQTELLFVALFLRMLKMGGRCACIVPNGVLFRSNSKAYEQLRRELVENQKLEAVIYMPSGVFKPYSGVSTAILVSPEPTRAAPTTCGSTTWRATATRSTTSATPTRSTTIFPTSSRAGATSTPSVAAVAPRRASSCPRARSWRTATTLASTSTRRPSTNAWSTRQPRRSFLISTI